MNKVKVTVRIRPLIEREKESGGKKFWKGFGNTIQQVLPEKSSSLKKYDFDRVFGENITTEEVYTSVVQPVVQNSLRGYNGTVLCYGQTSSGKTFTMHGSDEEPGLITLATEEIFERIETDTEHNYSIWVTLLELYNEKVFDLMAEDIKEIKLFEDSNGVVTARHAQEFQMLSHQDVQVAAKRLQTARRVSATKMNKESSRSHTIMTIRTEITDKMRFSEGTDFSKSKKIVMSSYLNLVDLAGSEKVDQSEVEGETFRESVRINQSLSTLKQVVLQLSQATANCSHASEARSSTKPTTTAPASHVPFRNSKLTRLLQNSFGGNAYVSLICNVTPASLEDTLSTLRLAHTATSIHVNPRKNLKDLPSVTCNLTDSVSVKINDILHHLKSLPSVRNVPMVNSVPGITDLDLKKYEQLYKLLREKLFTEEEDVTSGLNSFKQEHIRFQLTQKLDQAKKKLAEQEKELFSLRAQIRNFQSRQNESIEDQQRSVEASALKGKAGTFSTTERHSSNSPGTHASREIFAVQTIWKDYEKIKGELAVLESWKRECVCFVPGKYSRVHLAPTSVSSMSHSSGAEDFSS